MPASKDEFQQMQRDVQRVGGGTHIMALARAPLVPNMPNRAAQVAAQQLDARQVVSIFDTRPIDAYDFVATATGSVGGTGVFIATQPGDEFDVGLDAALEAANNAPRPKAGAAANMCTVNFTLPVGFVAVIRRIEFTVLPAHNSATITTPLVVRPLRSDSAIPDNDVQLFGVVESYGWDTHQVFGYWEVPGLVFTFGDLADHGVGARILGTLIPARNAEPKREIGSTPLVVKR